MLLENHSEWYFGRKMAESCPRGGGIIVQGENWPDTPHNTYVIERHEPLRIIRILMTARRITISRRSYHWTVKNIKVFLQRNDTNPDGNCECPRRIAVFSINWKITRQTHSLTHVLPSGSLFMRHSCELIPAAECPLLDLEKKQTSVRLWDVIGT